MNVPRVLSLLIVLSMLVAIPPSEALADPSSARVLVDLPSGGQAIQGEFYSPGWSPDGTTAAGSRSLRTSHFADHRPGDPVSVAAQLSKELGRPVYPNVVGKLAQTGDTYFPDQWPLENTGLGGGTTDADIDATDAWLYSTGEPSVVVAIIDSGLDAAHPDLSTQLWANPGEIAGNGLDDDGNGYIDDTYGWNFVEWNPVPYDDVDHGTAVAGVIAAAANGEGIVGVAPGVSLMPLRVCFLLVGEGRCPAAEVIGAVEYAVDNGATVINLSLGFIDEIEAAGLDAALRRARDAGITVVAAAGNEASNLVLYPARSSFENVVAVVSTDRNDGLSWFSSYSATEVELGAPGEEIWSSAVLLPGFIDFGSFDGTSFAAPHVTGTIALMLSVNPALTPVQIIDLLQVYGDQKPSLSTTTISGARLNAGRTVFAAHLVDVHDSVFRDDIVWLAATGITKGCNPPDNTRFCPGAFVSRGEMAAFLVRALGLKAGAGSDAFSDDDTSIFEADIERLAAAGITKGCNPPDNTLFCPDDPVTRGQMAAFLVRAFGYSDASGGSFADVAADSVFRLDIDRLATAGITKGCNPPDNTFFCPLDKVTRGQMAAFLQRALG